MWVDATRSGPTPTLPPTPAYLTDLTALERLGLQAATGNPHPLLHAKIILLRVGGETWSAVGSLNGGEISHKVNREVS